MLTYASPVTKPKKQIPNPKAPKPQKKQIPNPTQNPKKPKRNRLPTQKNVIEREHLLLLDVKGIEVAPELVEAHAGGREDAGEEGREAAEAEVVAGKGVRAEEAKELLLDAAAELGARHQLLDGRGGYGKHKNHIKQIFNKANIFDLLNFFICLRRAKSKTYMILHILVYKSTYVKKKIQLKILTKFIFLTYVD